MGPKKCTPARRIIIDNLTGNNVTLNDPTINNGTITGTRLVDVQTATGCNDECIKPDGPKVVTCDHLVTVLEDYQKTLESCGNQPLPQGEAVVTCTELDTSLRDYQEVLHNCDGQPLTAAQRMFTCDNLQDQIFINALRQHGALLDDFTINGDSLVVIDTAGNEFPVLLSELGRAVMLALPDCP